MTYDEQTRILKPAEGKYITNGTAYGTEAKLAPGDSPDNWREIDEAEAARLQAAANNAADEYANTEPEE